jgi:hypothetical protein
LTEVVKGASIYIGGEQFLGDSTIGYDPASGTDQTVFNITGSKPSTYTFTDELRGEVAEKLAVLMESLPVPDVGHWVEWLGSIPRLMRFHRDGRMDMVFRGHCGWHAVTGTRLVRSLKRPFRSLGSARRAVERCG